MKTAIEIKSAQELIMLTLSGKLNTDPIGQRPPVSKGFTKSIQIIESMLNGNGIGMITLRDISNDVEAQKIYPGVDYLVIDGGHRIRALVAFFKCKFSVNFQNEKVTFSMCDDLDLDSFVIPISICACTPQEATNLFKTINTTTPVNFMEMIMSDDELEVCKEIRVRTKYYKEYDNTSLPIFHNTTSDRGDTTSDSFNIEPNHRRKWDEYVAIAMIKTIGGGNVDAGQPEIESLVKQKDISKLNIVDLFFQDGQEFRVIRKKKFNSDVFAAFQLVWFGLYGENSKFKIHNHKVFARTFMKIYSKLSGKADRSLNNKIILFNNQEHLLKEFFRKNIKNFSNGLKQQECFKQFMKLTSIEELGVIYRDEKRSLTSREREELLAQQEYKCAIDGNDLDLEDAVFGHNIAWSKCGNHEDGAMIRNIHNTEMGSLTLDEYRGIQHDRT